MKHSKLVQDLHNSETRRKRLSKLSTITIKHPQFKNALAKMEECIALKGPGNSPRCMMLTGESGAGKTTVIQHLVEHFPRHDFGNVTCIPVFSAIIPRPATTKGVVSNMLQSLEPISRLHRTENAMTRRLYTLLRECQVKLIVLDEFQHLVEHTTERNAMEVSDWIKTFINETGIPIVLCGLPSAAQVIGINPQLARRFQTRFHLPRFEWERHKATFEAILQGIDKELPFTQLSGLSNLDMPRRLIYASQGNMASLMQLIHCAGEFAIANDSARIEREDFVQAYALHGQNPNINPFELTNEQFMNVVG